MKSKDLVSKQSKGIRIGLSLLAAATSGQVIKKLLGNDGLAGKTGELGAMMVGALVVWNATETLVEKQAEIKKN